ncbi:invasion associated locus B family protein [Hyphobacterium marinum]|uniref:Invasion associated locus B family protein n=1 Tax=Hyphobacterium marinum TaxID=3116574 RepID=A0ABU7LUT2_9PROT|nr:invasion associated locus B family protein [Hyphobacterium sp. Y6023]MEE2565299.1 invasion associated locus B family protein [Hyphobacterium sp. Y6023]
MADQMFRLESAANSALRWRNTPIPASRRVARPMILVRTVIAAALSATAITAAASAQTPTSRGSFSDWHVFTVESDRGLVCYALTQPTDSTPSNVDHGEIFFIVSTWASGAAEEQPRFAAGYVLRPDSPPTARVGSDRFPMFVTESDGFIEDRQDERRLVSAMRRGATMRVEATSQRGTATAYEFSLSGVTAALERVESLC